MYSSHRPKRSTSRDVQAKQHAAERVRCEAPEIKFWLPPDATQSPTLELGSVTKPSLHRHAPARSSWLAPEQLMTCPQVRVADWQGVLTLQVPQDTTPPQPSGRVPHDSPAGHALGMQLQVPTSVWRSDTEQVSGKEQEPHVTEVFRDASSTQGISKRVPQESVAQLWEGVHARLWHVRPAKQVSPAAQVPQDMLAPQPSEWLPQFVPRDKQVSGMHARHV